MYSHPLLLLILQIFIYLSSPISLMAFSFPVNFLVTASIFLTDSSESFLIFFYLYDLIHFLVSTFSFQWVLLNLYYMVDLHENQILGFSYLLDIYIKVCCYHQVYIPPYIRTYTHIQQISMC